MPERKFSEMLTQSLQNINVLVDSSKVMGTPVKISEDKTLIPITKITFGFGVGGSEFETKNNKIVANNLIEDNDSFPYGGGTLGGVNILPIGFLLIDDNSAKIISVEPSETLFDKLLDLFITTIKKTKQKPKD